MSHSHPARRGLALVAAGGVGLTMVACSSANSDSAPSQSPKTTSTSHASPSRTSTPPALSEEETSSVNTLVGLGVTANGDQPGGGMSGILPPGQATSFSTDAGPAGTYGVKVGCLGGDKAVTLTVVIRPKGMDDKSRITVPFECPKGTAFGYGKTVYTGQLSKSNAVELHNDGSVPVKFGMSVQPAGTTS